MKVVPCENCTFLFMLLCGFIVPFLLEWLSEADGSHAKTFSKNGSCWVEQCEDGNPNWRTYIEFVKMGIKANPVGEKSDCYSNIFS